MNILKRKKYWHIAYSTPASTSEYFENHFMVCRSKHDVSMTDVICNLISKGIRNPKILSLVKISKCDYRVLKSYYYSFDRE